MKLFLSFIAISVILLTYYKPGLMINPGKLSLGHENIQDDCRQCHVPLRGISGDKCISCHEPEKIGKFRVNGEVIVRDKTSQVIFHAPLSAKTCMACHTDHTGPDLKLTGLFEHSVLDQNTLQNCVSCHIKPADSLHRKQSSQCGTCHDTAAWSPAEFEHDKWFRFDRDHPSKCSNCHNNDNYTRYSCYNCHEHSPENIREEHDEEGIRDYKNCTRCHKSGDEDEAKRAFRMLDKNGYYKKNKHDDDDDDDD